MIIQTKRLVLRDFIDADAQEMMRQSREPQMRRFLPDQVYANLDEALESLAYLRANTISAAQPRYPYVLAIARKDTNAYIGHVGLSAVEGGIEIGFGLGTAYRGKGYVQEAAEAFLADRMRAFELREVYGIADPENEPSISVLKAVGFVYQEERHLKWVYKLVRPVEDEWEGEADSE